MTIDHYEVFESMNVEGETPDSKRVFAEEVLTKLGYIKKEEHDYEEQE